MSSRKIQYDCLQLAWRINHEQKFDGFGAICIEGKQRIGKSSYSSQSLAEAQGEWSFHGRTIKCEEANFDEVKPWMVFPPKEFLALVLDIPIGVKEKAAIWDDAGFWLFALDWYEPFVKAVSRYMQLCGRQFGFLILTTPSKKLISGKVLEALPDLYVCKIVRRGKDTVVRRPRLAKVYERWDYPDGKKGGVKTRWRDRFDAMLPDSFFKWYKPKSDKYMNIGLEILKKEVMVLRARMDKREKGDFMEKVHTVAGDPELIKEFGEVLGNLESEPIPKAT